MEEALSNGRRLRDLARGRLPPRGDVVGRDDVRDAVADEEVLHEKLRVWKLTASGPSGR